MIYLITGVPGSGKTLYAVSTLVQKLAAEKLVKRGKRLDRRVVVDGIPDLAIPHQLMGPVDEDEKGNLVGEGDTVLNWFKWCQPGDVLVIDEVQRYWRPRGMGTKPPEMIKALETHRHLGVDFIVITQNPMLIDQNVRRLVGRHQHIRRLFGMGRAVIYDWDGCSVDVHRTKTATMTMWAYPSSAFSLYKSSELHTKQKQKFPLWLALPVLALIGFILVFPTAFRTMQGSMTGKGVSQSTSSSSSPVPAQNLSQLTPGSQIPVPVVAPGQIPAAPGLPRQSDKTAISGCILHPVKGCVCLDQLGRSADLDPGICLDLQDRRKPLEANVLPDPPVARKTDPDQLETLLALASAKQWGPSGVGMGETHAKPSPKPF